MGCVQHACSSASSRAGTRPKNCRRAERLRRDSCRQRPLSWPSTFPSSSAIFNGGPSPFGTPDLTLLGCLIALNEADGGAAGVGGSDGSGQGGGLYNLGTISAETATHIALNHASTSNNDVYP